MTIADRYLIVKLDASEITLLIKIAETYKDIPDGIKKVLLQTKFYYGQGWMHVIKRILKSLFSRAERDELLNKYPYVLDEESFVPIVRFLKRSTDPGEPFEGDAEMMQLRTKFWNAVQNPDQVPNAVLERCFQNP